MPEARDQQSRGRGRPPIQTITPSQQLLLEAIESHIQLTGVSPTLRELSRELGHGVASIFKSIERLERNGYICRSTGKPRALSVLKSAESQIAPAMVSIPLLGEVAAGIPIFSVENLLGEVLVEADVIRAGRYFALTVFGKSMIRAGIQTGDIVIVRQQQLANHHDIVVVLFNDEATLKRLHHQAGQIMLLPENPRFAPISVGPDDDLRIVGKVVAVRHYDAGARFKSLV